MFVRWSISCLAVAAVAIVGCSMRSVAPAPNVPPSSMESAFVQPDSFGNWLYACGAQLNGCDVYKVAGTKLTYFETLTTGFSIPEGAVATVNGFWYQTNQQGHDVVIYKSNTTGPTKGAKTLLDPNERPVDVDADPTLGIVAVSNLQTTSGSPSGNVAIYKSGATTASSFLHYTVPSGNTFGLGIAIDKNGNCFWSVSDVAKFKMYIVEFKSCAGKGTVIVTGGAAGGVAFDGSNNLYYVDQFNATVNKCTGTKSCKVLNSTVISPQAIQFDSGWKHLWVTDSGNTSIDALNPTTGVIESTNPFHGGASKPDDWLALAPGAGN
jgi:hypothetical protein